VLNNLQLEYSWPLLSGDEETIMAGAKKAVRVKAYANGER